MRRPRAVWIVLVGAAMSAAGAPAAAQTSTGPQSATTASTVGTTTQTPGPGGTASGPTTNGAAAGTNTANANATAADSASAAAGGATRQGRAVAHYERGWAYYALGRYRLASQELESAVRLDPNGYNLYFDLGLVYERLGEVDRAIGAYRRYYAHASEPAERERADRIVRRLQGARAELAELRNGRRGLADGWFWFTGATGIAGIGVGTGLLLVTPALAVGAGREAYQIAGTLSLAAGITLVATAAALYAGRDAPADRSWLRATLGSGALLHWSF